MGSCKTAFLFYRGTSQANVEKKRVKNNIPSILANGVYIAGREQKRSPNVNYKEVRTSSKHTKRLIGLDWILNFIDF